MRGTRTPVGTDYHLLIFPKVRYGIIIDTSINLDATSITNHTVSVALDTRQNRIIKIYCYMLHRHCVCHY